ncbi:hypothetical protein C0Q70_16439 [Pomacea canaliculata]|uniref:Uncharacterized protein n=1 Tax=Pomacea canaliculata TaxID=400727 RepID=A0A2T7NPU9_POMCA|nr:hypothetical protein C0Q70_16439 [Pomacea canaliculata]
MPGNMLKSKQGTRMLQSVRSNQLTSSGSRKTTTSEKIISEKPSFVRGIQIYDEEGNDVTPLPLLTLDPSLVRKNQTSILGEGSTTTPSEFASQAAGLSATGSMYGGPFSRSVFTQSNDTDSGPDEDSISEMTSTWSAGITDTTSQGKKLVSVGLEI